MLLEKLNFTLTPSLFHSAQLLHTFPLFSSLFPFTFAANYLDSYFSEKVKQLIGNSINFHCHRRTHTHDCFIYAVLLLVTIEKPSLFMLESNLSIWTLNSTPSCLSFGHSSNNSTLLPYSIKSPPSTIHPR